MIWKIMKMSRQIIGKYSFAVAVVAIVVAGVQKLNANPTIDKGQGYLLGTTTGEPADPTTELDRLQDLINNYNPPHTALPPSIDGVLDAGSKVPSPNLPFPTVVPTQVMTSSMPTSFDINLGTSEYYYLEVKWGGGTGGGDAFYYIGGLTGTLDIVNDIFFNSGKGAKPLGASHYELIGPENSKEVPDGISTALLLGSVLSICAVIKSKLLKGHA
jgi:hypothetical protein